MDRHDESGSSVLSPSDIDAHSPAFQDDSPVDDDALPNEVVTAFLESLRSGDDDRAAALLTDLARRATERENLTVQPPGSPDAKYTVGGVEYVSQANEGAHVHSTWTEPDDGGLEDPYKITWVLRRQKRNGWRVKGMITKLSPAQSALFLDFEDPKEMFRKIQVATAEIAKQQESGLRQARNPSNDSQSNFK